MEIKSNIPFTGNADLSGLKIDRSIKESNLDSGKARGDDSHSAYR